MKSTVEQLSPTRVRINVEVPFEELKPEFDKAYKALAQQFRIPGFRPGKAPARIIEARVGRGPILEQVVNDVIPNRYSQAVTEGDVKVLGQPDIEITKIEDGELLEFTAEVDIRPEITLPDYSEVTVTVDPLTVTDEDVEEALTNLRRRFGSIVATERGATKGDIVTIDLSATVDGEDVPEAATEGMSHEVGSDQLIDGLDEALEGLAAGESKEFTTKLLAGDHAGQEATVTVTVGTVKERQLPEADDDFAQEASEFDTIDELKADLRTRTEQSKKMAQVGQIREKVVDHLLETLDIPVPEAVVKAETDEQIHNLVHQFEHNDELLNQLLEGQGKTRESWEAEVREGAERAVKIQLLLDAIAEAEGTQVSQDELTTRILMQAQRFGMKPEEYIAEIQKANQLGAVFADVRRGKALQQVIERVTVTDTDGNVVDLAAEASSEDETQAEEAE
ncbi:trigger factor [Smaragdicoccus niigatensis]|uniref:trigger factor n=1 Tax=Smaragdicoccus niigatensis TaxID=359359 RepID=UPI00038280A1|nr:trigger factor [Smaragdicoccus niigatensis]